MTGPQRCYPDLPGLEDGGERTGNRSDLSTSSSRRYHWQLGHRKPDKIGAGRGDNGFVKRRRRTLEQSRNSRRTEDDIVPVCMAYCLYAFPGEETNRNALRDGQSEQQ